MVGITYKVKKVEKIIPEEITTPLVSLLASPGPEPKISGSTPTMVEREVIKIGLNLTLQELRIASLIF